MFKRIITAVLALCLLVSMSTVSTVGAEEQSTFILELTVKGDGTAHLSISVPAGVASGKIVFGVSEDLTYVAGSATTSTSLGYANDLYGDGLICLTFANTNAYTQLTEVLTADYTVKAGASITVDDIAVTMWNVTDGMEYVGEDKYGDVDKTVVNYYTVIFKGHNGAVLSTQSVKEGDSAVAPTAPAVAGYSFDGWDKSFDNITANTTVNANYEINKYTVKFVDYDGSVLSTETVEYGSAATAPANPVREGYTFTGWDKAFANITANTTVNAVYTKNACTVTFVAGEGGSIKGDATLEVAVGTDLSTVTFPELSCDKNRIFLAWDKTEGTVDGNITVTASFGLLGDVTADGKVNALDAAFILRYDAGLTPASELDLSVADVTGDGKINALDAAFVLRYDAGLESVFPAWKA